MACQQLAPEFTRLDGTGPRVTRVPCSCGWVGSWFLEPVDAFQDHAGHRRRMGARYVPPPAPEPEAGRARVAGLLALTAPFVRVR